MKEFLKRHKTFLIISLIFFILRIPSLFEPHWYVDEGIYSSISYGMSQGQLFYRDIYDHKPQLMFYLYQLFGNTDKLLVAKIANMFAGLLMLTGVYVFMKKHASKKKAEVATGILTFLIGTTLFEGNIANAEVFFLPLVIWAIFLTLKDTPKHIFLAGLLFGVAFLLKFHPLFDLIAVGVFLLGVEMKKSTQKVDVFRKHILKKYVIIGIGFIIPIVLMSFIELARGNFGNFIQIAFVDAYIYSGETVLDGFVGFLQSTIFKGLVLFIYTIFVSKAFFLSKTNKTVYLLLLLFGFEVFGAFLSGRGYRHYLLHPSLAFSMLTSIYLYGKWSLKEKLGEKAGLILKQSIVLIVLAMCFISGYRSEITTADRRWSEYLYPIEYYYNFGEHLLSGTIGSPEYNNFFNYQEERLKNLKKNIDDFNPEGVYIYSYGGWPYYYIKKVPPTKITVAFQIYYKDVQQNKDEIIADLKDNDVELIVVDVEVNIFDELTELLDNDYILIEEDGKFMYYLNIQELL